MSIKKLISLLVIISWIQIPVLGWSEEKSLKDITREYMEKQKEEQKTTLETRQHRKKWASPMTPIVSVLAAGACEWMGIVFIPWGLEDLAKIKNPPIYKHVAPPRLPSRFEAIGKIGLGGIGIVTGGLFLWDGLIKPFIQEKEVAANFEQELHHLGEKIHDEVVLNAFVDFSEKGNAWVRAPQNSLLQEEFLLHQVLLARAQEKSAEEINFWTSHYIDLREQQKTLMPQDKEKELAEVSTVYANMQQDQVRQTIVTALGGVAQ